MQQKKKKIVSYDALVYRRKPSLVLVKYLYCKNSSGGAFVIFCYWFESLYYGQVGAPTFKDSAIDLSLFTVTSLLVT